MVRRHFVKPVDNLILLKKNSNKNKKLDEITNDCTIILYSDDILFVIIIIYFLSKKIQITIFRTNSS